MRVLVELSPTMDAEKWSYLHGLGLVPDYVPYGLDRLADDGYTVVVRTAPQSRTINLASRLVGKVSGGARWPESLLGRPFPSAADVRLCWDERTGIPAVLAQPPWRHRQPVVTGAIWVCEPDARLSTSVRWTVGNALRRADAVFVLSSGQQSTLRETWGVDANRIHLVHFGVDTDFWDPSIQPTTEASANTEHVTHDNNAWWEKQRLPIVSVGNDRHRDHGLLVAAAQVVHSKIPMASLEMVTRTAVHIASDVGRWQPSLAHVQLRDLYKSAQVVAISTRPNNHASGITAILEGMAMGKPVVATRTPGLEDYVSHGQTGILVPSGDVEAMAGVLIELLQDPDRCAYLATEARKRVLSIFSTKAQARRLAAVLGTVA